MDANQDARFTTFLREAAQRAQSDIKYTPNYFLGSLGAEGGYATVSKLLVPGKPPSEGFVKLWEHGRLDLSVEALVLESEWRVYFGDEVLKVARSRLASVGYRVRESELGGGLPDVVRIGPVGLSAPNSVAVQSSKGDPDQISHRVWRISGPPENFLVAIQRRFWALNEFNKGTWEKISEGDFVVFHSTRTSAVVKHPPSVLLGFATVGSQKAKKQEHWWPTEISESSNHWPYTFSLSSICLASASFSALDHSTPFHLADASQKMEWVNAMLEHAIPISSIEREAKARVPELPNLPINGSIAPINEVYRQVIFLTEGRYWDLVESEVPADQVEASLVDDVDIEGASWDDTFSLAASYRDPKGLAHEKRLTKVRVESAIQKYRVAYLENFTCQVCSYRQGYIGRSGKKRWIIHVDHIYEKALGGGEEMSNLWVLCPRCHMEKTHGVLTIEPLTYDVHRLGHKISMRDCHLLIKKT